MTRFTIEATYDLPHRPGLMTHGRIQSGAVRAGMILRIEGTSQDVRILAVELTCTAGSTTTRPALMTDRTHTPLLQPGTVLVSPS